MRFQDNAKQYSATARQRAIAYLERNLPFIDHDAYAVSIVAHAFALSKNALADVAFGKVGQVKWTYRDQRPH